MIAIDNTLISEEILEKKFVCDLHACKGECCVAGVSGAPLEESELAVMEKIYEKVKPYMNEEGIAEVEKQGVFVVDVDGDYVTPLVGGDKHCAFVYFDEHKIAKCAIEKAYYNKDIKFKKPISCHLYPIRIDETPFYTNLNFHHWDVCKPACTCGTKLDVPTYKFLKEPLIRKFGKRWYNKLEKAATLKLST
jgi:hypothetical protein